MTVDEYINSVILNIKNKSARENVEKELRDYITDSTERYIAIGYDEATATQKALERMGDGKITGQQFGKLYARKFVIIADLLMLLLGLFLVFLLIDLLPFTKYKAIDPILLMAEPFILTIYFYTIISALMWKNPKILYASGPFFFSYFILRIIKGSSPVIIYFYFFIKHKISDLYAVLNVNELRNSTPFSFLSILAVILYAFCALLWIIAYINSRKFSKRKNSLKDQKQNTKAIIVSVCSLVLCIVICLQSINNYSVYSENELYAYDSMILIQSDCICDIDNTDLTKYDKIILDYQAEKNSVHPDEKSADKITGLQMIVNEKCYNNIISYYEDTISFEYKISKKYIAVIHCKNDTVYYEEIKWYDTENSDKIKGKVPNKEIPLFNYEIAIVKE